MSVAHKKQKASALIMVVFIVSLVSTIVIGMLGINTEQIQTVVNQVNLAQASAAAEAGLNAAFAELRDDRTWDTGFNNQNFDGGTYSVTVSGALPEIEIESVGTSNAGYSAKLGVSVTVGEVSPYLVRVNEYRFNNP